jgi:hypothetical protein
MGLAQYVIIFIANIEIYFIIANKKFLKKSMPYLKPFRLEKVCLFFS